MEKENITFFRYISSCFAEIVQVNRWRNDAVKDHLRHQCGPSSCAFSLFQFNQTEQCEHLQALGQITLIFLNTPGKLADRFWLLSANGGKKIHILLAHQFSEFIDAAHPNSGLLRE